MDVSSSHCRNSSYRFRGVCRMVPAVTPNWAQQPTATWSGGRIEPGNRIARFCKMPNIVADSLVLITGGTVVRSRPPVQPGYGWQRILTKPSRMRCWMLKRWSIRLPSRCGCGWLDEGFSFYKAREILDIPYFSSSLCHWFRSAWRKRMAVSLL